MKVDLWMPYIMLMLVLLTFTLMQRLSGSANAKNKHCMLAETKQPISIYLVATVGLFYVTLTLICKRLYVLFLFFDKKNCHPDMTFAVDWAL